MSARIDWQVGTTGTRYLTRSSGRQRVAFRRRTNKIHETCYSALDKSRAAQYVHLIKNRDNQTSQREQKGDGLSRETDGIFRINNRRVEYRPKFSVRQDSSERAAETGIALSVKPVSPRNQSTSVSLFRR